MSKAIVSLIAAVVLAGLRPSIEQVQAQTPRVITDAQASQYVGQTVTVEGLVAQVGHSRRSNTTFLDFGARYPNHTFVAVIFASAANRFPNPDQWEGRRVRVTGRVQMYRERPEIILESASQLVPVP